MGLTALREKKNIHRQNPAARDDTLRSKDTKRSVYRHLSLKWTIDTIYNLNYECQWSIWEIGDGNALISLRSTVKQEEDASRAGCSERAQDSWTVCGSEVKKNYINTVQFLVQTDRFVSLELNVSSRATGFNLVLSVYVFFLSKPWVPLTAIIWLTDCNGLS